MAGQVSSQNQANLSIANKTCLPPLQSSTSIRLIELIRGEQDSDIVMSLETYNMPSLPVYIALSYTWGDPLTHPYSAEKPSRMVWVNSKQFTITPNLYDALDHWRGWKVEIGTVRPLLWVDAICIDQSDLIERNHQVGLMSQIYSKAALVLSWIGRSDRDAWTALKLIFRFRPIVEIWESDKSQFIYSHDADELFERAGVTPVKPEEWKALISFYRRQYFGRVWIVQEIVLAKSSLLMFGHYFIPWAELMNLSDMLVSCNWIPILEGYGRTSISVKEPRLTLGAPAVYGHIRSICEQYSPGKSDQSRDLAAYSSIKAFNCLLEILLYETRWFRATDPRDNIYAILSIVSHVFGTTYTKEDLWRPDYRLSVSKLFINVTREIATRTGSTSILSLVDHDEKQLSDLPSWVPDYSASDIQALAFVCHSSLYRAFHVVQRSPDLAIVGNEFFVCAVRWDTIIETELTGHPFTLQGSMDLCLQLPEIYLNGQTRVEALWRTLIGDSVGRQSPADEAIGKSFLQYVLLTIATRIRKVLETWDGSKLEMHEFASLFSLADERSQRWLPNVYEVEFFWNTFQAMRQDPEENEKMLREVGQKAHSYAAAIASLRHGRKLFRTAGSLLGLAPKSAKHGDTVWFFPGSKVPFVLRHYDGKRHRLIGEAYLHGYMHGELERFSVPLQHISLV